MTRVKAFWTIFLLSLITFALIPPQWLAMKFGWKVQRKLPYLWHRAATSLLGIRISQQGKPEMRRPLLIVANHASWVDITVIGSLKPLSFIAKSEVAGWPVFGLFARLQRTVFVNRTKRSETGQVAGEIAKRMSQGDAMVLFAEGTSNDGNSVLPFRSALLGAATRAVGEGEEVWVQPMSVAYLALHGVPMGRQLRPHVAWYGDMEMADHLWGVLTRGPMDVQITWGEPVLVNAKTDRKALTRQMEDSVRKMTGIALRGGEGQLLEEVTPEVAEEADAAFFSSAQKAGKAGA
ncbi:lysophospholipid acyltransferase family protein [Roseibium sp.]|uniref:lysophospholipid acyltransferase family protein n=1 Tax=Roseibium sp. TaxID=1936156 RepID=UPI003A96E028